jgi:SagB-type dehydrogenase family enzyme
MSPIIRAIRQRLGVIVSLTLLVVISATFLTGFVAAALDLNRFVLHKYAAYATIGVAAIHVALHWRLLVAQVRRWLLPGVRPDARAARHSTTSRAEPRIAFGRRSFLALILGLLTGLGLGRWWTGRTPPPVFAEGDDLGQVYHRWSTPTYAGLLAKAIAVAPQPPLYKEYPGATTVALPSPLPPGGPSLTEVLARRRSVREYSGRALTLEELSRLLHGATGITDRRDPTLFFRSVPSSGALYPLEIYPIVFDVAGVAPGVYHYDPLRHRLNLVRGDDVRAAVFQGGLSQEMFRTAPLVLVVTGLFPRVQFKYVDRSYRYIMLEAGHLGQNIYLTATALGLAPCGVGAFFDDDFNRIVGVDGEEELTVYVMCIGARD